MIELETVRGFYFKRGPAGKKVSQGNVKAHFEQPIFANNTKVFDKVLGFVRWLSGRKTRL